MSNVLDKILLNLFIFIFNGILPGIGAYYLIINFNNSFLILIPVLILLLYNIIYLISFLKEEVKWGENTIFILIKNISSALKESSIRKYNTFNNWCKNLKKEQQ